MSEVLPGADTVQTSILASAKGIFRGPGVLNEEGEAGK